MAPPYPIIVCKGEKGVTAGEGREMSQLLQKSDKRIYIFPEAMYNEKSNGFNGTCSVTEEEVV